MMKLFSSTNVWFISFVLLFLSAACVVPSSLSGFLQQAPAQATVAVEITPPGQIETKVAGQQVKSTQRPRASATATLYPTLRPSSTPWPTSTPVSAMPRRATCDLTGFVADVTVPDGSNLAGGTENVKTWKLRNNGACSWTSAYNIVFYKGDSLTFKAQPLPKDVGSGETVEVSVSFTAPKTDGHYRTYFQLQNKRGKTFLGSFYVDFNVVTLRTPTPDPAIRYEFAQRQCDAVWSNGIKPLACPSTSGSADGFMQLVEKPVLESGYVDNEPGLLTNPPAQANGVIGAIYPPFLIMYGDHFRTIIGCERGATKCDVRFDLSYVANGMVYPVQTWSENYNEAYTQVDIDLSSLAGQSVQFVLAVSANGSSTNNRALWLRPRIISD